MIRRDEPSENPTKGARSKKTAITCLKNLPGRISKSVPEEIKSFLNERLPQILDFPEKFGLNIKSAGHLLDLLIRPHTKPKLESLCLKMFHFPRPDKIYQQFWGFKVMIILPENWILQKLLSTLHVIFFQIVWKYFLG
ncbi:MAG: hypothetical protein CM1200mP30_29150 [Pseudomonadota bacterium]|nr:MAG: hypothetical protein CM1200mP30_29150 [Pseudomonadota bacterium]